MGWDWDQGKGKIMEWNWEQKKRRKKGTILATSPADIKRILLKGSCVRKKHGLIRIIELHVGI